MVRFKFLKAFGKHSQNAKRRTYVLAENKRLKKKRNGFRGQRYQQRLCVLRNPNGQTTFRGMFSQEIGTEIITVFPSDPTARLNEDLIEFFRIQEFGGNAFPDVGPEINCLFLAILEFEKDVVIG
jgi:hypothetical protein